MGTVWSLVSTSLRRRQSMDLTGGAVIHNDYVDFCTVRGGKIVAYSAVIGPILPGADDEQKGA